MWTVILDVIVLTLGAAAFIDMSVGMASGALQLADADHSLAPRLFRCCMLGEAMLTASSIGWFCFAAPNRPREPPINGGIKHSDHR